MYPLVTGSRRAHQLTSVMACARGIQQAALSTLTLNLVQTEQAPQSFKKLLYPSYRRSCCCTAFYPSHCCYCSLPSKLNFSEERRWKHARARLHTHTHTHIHTHTHTHTCVQTLPFFLPFASFSGSLSSPGKMRLHAAIQVAGQSEPSASSPPPPPPKDVLSSSSSTC